MERSARGVDRVWCRTGVGRDRLGRRLTDRPHDVHGVKGDQGADRGGDHEAGDRRDTQQQRHVVQRPTGGQEPDRGGGDALDHARHAAGRERCPPYAARTGTVAPLVRRPHPLGRRSHSTRPVPVTWKRLSGS